MSQARPVPVALLVGMAVQIRIVRDVAATGAEQARLAAAETRDPGTRRLGLAVERVCLALTGAAHLQSEAAPDPPPWVPPATLRGRLRWLVTGR